MNLPGNNPRINLAEEVDIRFIVQLLAEQIPEIQEDIRGHSLSVAFMETTYNILDSAVVSPPGVCIQTPRRARRCRLQPLASSHPIP